MHIVYIPISGLTSFIHFWIIVSLKVTVELSSHKLKENVPFCVMLSSFLGSFHREVRVLTILINYQVLTGTVGVPLETELEWRESLSWHSMCWPSNSCLRHPWWTTLSLANLALSLASLASNVTTLMVFETFINFNYLKFWSQQQNQNCAYPDGGYDTVTAYNALITVKKCQNIEKEPKSTLLNKR